MADNLNFDRTSSFICFDNSKSNEENFKSLKQNGFLKEIPNRENICVHKTKMPIYLGGKYCDYVVLYKNPDGSYRSPIFVSKTQLPSFLTSSKAPDGYYSPVSRQARKRILNERVSKIKE